MAYLTLKAQWLSADFRHDNSFFLRHDSRIWQLYKSLKEAPTRTPSSSEEGLEQDPEVDQKARMALPSVALPAMALPTIMALPAMVLPAELFSTIVADMVAAVGLHGTTTLRLVSKMFDYEVDNAIFKGGYLKTAPQPYSRHLSRSLYRRYLLFELAMLRGKCSRLAWMLHACMELYEFGIENETGFAAKARDLSRGVPPTWPSLRMKPPKNLCLLLDSLIDRELFVDSQYALEVHYNGSLYPSVYTDNNLTEWTTMMRQISRRHAYKRSGLMMRKGILMTVIGRSEGGLKQHLKWRREEKGSMIP